MAALNKDNRAAYRHQQNQLNPKRKAKSKPMGDHNSTIYKVSVDDWNSDMYEYFRSPSYESVSIYGLTLNNSDILKYFNIESYKSKKILEFKHSNETSIKLDIIINMDKLSNHLIKEHKSDGFVRLLPFLIKTIKMALYNIHNKFICNRTIITLEVCYSDKLIDTCTIKI